jgi:hypothetical protein
LRSIKKNLAIQERKKGKDAGKAQECKYRVFSVVEVPLRPMIISHTRYMANDLLGLPLSMDKSFRGYK